MDKILLTTYTFTILQKRLRALRSYLLHRFFSSQPDQQNSLKGVDITVNDLSWIYSLGNDFISGFNRDNVYSKLQLLEMESKKLPLVILYLAFEPNDEAVRLIGEFLRNQFSASIIFEYKNNPALIGGVAVSWKGIYKDYSVKELINQKQSEILMSFKTYLKK